MRRTRRIWAIAILLTISLACALPAADKPASSPASQGSKLIVAKDTTFVTGPLHADGTVNYLAAVNEMYGQGATNENNAAVLLLRAYGPQAIVAEFRQRILKELSLGDLPEQGQYLERFASAMTPEQIAALGYEPFEAATTRPGDAPFREELLQWLKKNEKSLDLVVAASERSRFFVPWVSNENPPTMWDGLVAFSYGSTRGGCRALAARAIVKAQEGNLDAAAQDLAAVHRLARLLAQGPTLLNQLSSLACDFLACKAEQGIALHVKMTPSQTQVFIRMIHSFSPWPLPTAVFDAGERLFTLDCSMLVVRGGLEGLVHHLETTWSKYLPQDRTKQAAPLPKFELDVNEYLRAINEDYDQIAQCAQGKSYPKRKAAFDAMEKDVPSVLQAVYKETKEDVLSGRVARKRITLVIEKMGTGDRKGLSRMLGLLDLSELSSGVTRRSFAMADQERMQQMLSLVAMALAACRADTGSWPASLDALAPKYLNEVPADLFIEQPLKYQVQGARYVLYSVGPNMRDDGGVKEFSSSESDNKDDIAISSE